jgi:ethanolamine transporter EutH
MLDEAKAGGTGTDKGGTGGTGGAGDRGKDDKGKDDKGEWAGIIGSVTAPIGFFALSLLVIEAPFPVLFGLSHRTHNEFKWTVLVMSLLIVVVVTIVAILTWKDPKNLVEKIADKAADKITASDHAMASLAARVEGKLRD